MLSHELSFFLQRIIKCFTIFAFVLIFLIQSLHLQIAFMQSYKLLFQIADIIKCFIYHF